MSRVEHAVALFKERDNCSQAVLATYANQYGIQEKTALKIAEVFSGGIARKGNICGALGGALMVIGLHYGKDKDSDSAPRKSVYDVADELLEKFKSQHGTANCRELIHFDLTTPENRKLAQEMKVFRNCPKYVGSAVELLEDLL
ncbi:MAG: C-GCAxxG-C-C family protein [Candidatus Hodarchaeales archaeon]|jgi:C_GCAxxG_C_C family probable redox protein